MFRTEVPVAGTNLNLSLQDKVLTIGSCFADVIGAKLYQNKVKVLVNPFGTIFNPLSVCRLLAAGCGVSYNFEEHLVQNNGIWHAYDLHSSLSSPDKQTLLNQIGERLQQTKQQLQQAKLLIITLGTAVAYKLKSTSEVVANCHKLPARNFDRILLPVAEMQSAFEQVYAQLRAINPDINVLLTVSPVRHLKETLETNSVSKALLRVLCHQLTEAHDNVLYFPAYEIMLDDLRDYRFYKPDMLHPTEVAEDYIWQKFVQAYYTPDFQEYILAWDKMQRALRHRSFHPQSEAHQKFLKNTLQQLEQLASKHKIDVSEEARMLHRQQV
ncbi:GSCFA domain-containing protein [Pontibacter sp. 172403-2]|uniref:GSCFA domain-containing protein n=1 Tax=Pontibacter rufus TaxID=2791028 RepID=UPI0018AFE28B|nr:GSCFA domain-containing protein [Pontibacter sp. 172403-2]MBF9253892.1 GSCFA domain-containing protein [Pontibacter sp. 172403-2]